MDVINYLLRNKDEQYKKFNNKIVNTKMKMIGVRTPVIKKLAKQIVKDDIDISNFKYKYYEEVLLNGYVISYEKDTEKLINMLDIFINKIDNWAICDMVCAACTSLDNDKEKTLKFIKNNITSNNPWKVRFCFTILLNYFIKDNYLDLIFKYCDNDKNDFYYIMMSKAWLISTCFVKYPKETLYYLKTSKIDNITYNKAISKICDSKKVAQEDKNIVRKMKKK